MTIVSTLTLPINIMAMSTNLLASLRLPVMPMLNPTVLYAEKHSKAMLIKSFLLSKIVSKTMPDPITMRDREMVAKARLTEISAISLLKTSIRDFPFARLKIFKVAMASVLVLMPPPVDEGDAPTHIRKSINMVVGNNISAVLIVLKPAVLGVVAPNNAVTTFPIPWCSAKVLLYSMM